MDLAHQQQAPSSFQLSGPAMLVGTVAALQEESGQLRTQWKSDVQRLERELDQLRSAAAWALPHLAEAQRQQEVKSGIQAVMANGSQTERCGNTREAMLLHSTGNDRSMPMFPTGPPFYTPEMMTTQDKYPSGYSQFAEQSGLTEATEAIRKHQALIAQMRVTAAECGAGHESRATFEHERSASQLTEALMQQMCTSNASECPPLRAQAQQEHMPPQAAQEAPKRAGTTLNALGEMYQELERMEFALQQVREENTKLKEEKAAIEEAHSRDVSALEAMLSQVMAENKRLTKELSMSEEATMEAKKFAAFEDKIMSMKQQVPQTPSSVVSEEPEMEKSSEFNRAKFDIGVNVPYSFAG
jgi:hypothetical protein